MYKGDNGLSDFFSCLTKNKVRGDWAHEDTYLQIPGNAEEEVLVNIFDLLTRGDVKGLKYARKYAPNVVAEGEKLLREVAARIL